MAVLPSCVAQSIYRHKISDEFDNERNPPSNSRVIGPERLKIAVLNLVSPIETTFLNQPKLHKVVKGTRSWMRSIMSKIHQVTQKLFALELLKIAVFHLVSTIVHISWSVWTKVAQSIYRQKILDEFDNEWNPPSNTEVICPWIIENHSLSYVYSPFVITLGPTFIDGF